MKRILMALFLCALTFAALPALAAQTRIEPDRPVPDYVSWLLEVAGGEVGYKEGDHGWTKYGEWAGDPYAQWCAEYLCWCVDQVDQQHGTALLNTVYPMYSGSNTGRSWFIRQGRFVVRWGNLEGWGYQWLKGEDHFLTTGDYIPQPGDWVFFTWTSDENTDHVAMVEYCTRDDAGNVTIHCLEGNTPATVKRAEYDLHYSRILGYGTVHDMCDWTLRGGNSGEKVAQLQRKLVRLGALTEDQVDGIYGSATAQAIRDYQAANGIAVNGIANISTQTSINRRIYRLEHDNPDNWKVNDASVDDELTLDDFTDFDALLSSPAPEAAEEEEFTLLQDEDSPDADDGLTQDAVPDWYGEQTP